MSVGARYGQCVKWTDRDVQRLSAEQRTEFDRLERETQAPSLVRGVVIGLIVGCVAWLVLPFLAASYAGANRGDNSVEWLGSAVPIMLLVLMVGAVLGGVSISKARMRRMAEAATELEEFKTSVKAGRPRPSSVDDDTPLTVRQAQHHWYGTHSELNYTHREQGQMLGFDNADDYVNNWLESE